MASLSGEFSVISPSHLITSLLHLPLSSSSPPLTIPISSSLSEFYSRQPPPDEWSDDDGDDNNNKKTPRKSKKLADTNFGFFEATTPHAYSAVQIQREIQDATRINPPGVMVVGVRSETMGSVAGYLHFQTTGVVIKWLEDEDKLRGLLNDWLEGKKDAFGCSTKDFGVTQPFKIILGPTSEHNAGA
ncbi:uncharacterized protein EAE98_003213 [Botrytis deweyae]|uniref:Uncharacterized protein n=1 Tax=Botrytis deweyae TaxID=2478750 RepID=A0ABQ7IVY7_9HELO|nr:uncharacterized protein EAE98_003213 [Botrytis deweyae]KAF7935168.1 hypothetical protein EAE98_003213 [Botrytis deweyae]